MTLSTLTHTLFGVLLLFALLVFANRPAALAQGRGPSVSLQQCANDGDGSNPTCANGPGIGWKNSQINGNNGYYSLDDFYPNRQIFSNLTVGNVYCFAAGFDYSKGGLPTVDYLGSYNATLPADPTLGTSFTLGVDIPDTVAIPPEPALNNGGTIGGNTYTGTQKAGDLTLWGGTFDPGSLAYSNPGTGDLDANFQQSLEYCFTATSTEAVMAFGAHVSQISEWGHTTSPSGAAYHVSNGSRNGQFSAPRTGETDLAETLADGTIVGNYNVGRTEQQLQRAAFNATQPTAISLAGVDSGDNGNPLNYVFIGLLLVVAITVVRQRQKLS